MKLFSKLAVGLTCLIFSSSGFATTEVWDWYYARPGDLDRSVRYGIAELTISDGKISGHLIALHRGGRPTYPITGSISGENVTVDLPTFFPSYPIDFSGVIRKKTTDNSCVYQEIALHYSIPNGETLMISRVTGDDCDIPKTPLIDPDDF